MNYNSMMKKWNNFVNESYSPPSLHEEQALEEAMPSTIEKLKNLRPRDIEDYPFRNLFGDMLRRVVFMEVKPDGVIFDIQEFFTENGWEPKWGEGVITKEMQTLKGPKTVTIPIMKALIKVKNAVLGRDEKPEKFWKENNAAWRQYEVAGTHSLNDDAPKKARNLHAEWLKIRKNGRESFDRLQNGPAIWMERVESTEDTYGGKDIWKGRDFKKQPVEVEVPRSPIPGYMDENTRKVFQDKYPGMNVMLVNRANDFGGYDLWIRISIPDGGEFPLLQRAHLNRPAGQDQNLIESWIKYLNTPLPGVKGSGPALDYYTRNPEVLKTMDLKPVVISRDVIDIGRMSDFPSDGIDSCHTEGGMYDYCAIREADDAGLVSWLFEPEDLNEFLFPDDPDTPLSERSLDEINEALHEWDRQEIMYDPARDIDGMVPQARGRLRRYINTNEDYDLALPDPTIYGDRYPGFNKAIRDWALEEQEGYLPENYADMSEEEADEFFGSFVFTGGSYHSDAASGEMLNDFLGKDYYRHTQQVPYDDMGKYEQDREYRIEGGVEDMEDAASEIENRADLDHGGIWYEVQDYEHPPYLSYSGDFRWMFPSREGEHRTEKQLPNYAEPDEYRALREEIEAILYEYDFYYSDVEISPGSGGNIYITCNLENDYSADPDGFEQFVEWMETLDQDPWQMVRKKLRTLLRKSGLLSAGETLDDTLLSGMGNLEHFVEHEGSDKDFSFELKNLLPIGKGYNMPTVLARTYWASKKGGDPATLNYNLAYRDLQNGFSMGSGKGVEWHGMAKDLFQFVAREVVGDVGVEGEKQLELPLQEEEEITARTPQARAAEEETFAAATLEHLGKHLENFVVIAKAGESKPMTALGSTYTPDSSEWEEFGQRVGSSGVVKRGLQHTVPVEIDIIFDIDEEDTPKEMGVAIQMLLWMDKNLDKLQEHAGYLLQKYNDIYLKSVDARIASQNQKSGEIEDIAAGLGIAAEDMLKEWKKAVWDVEDAREEILGMANLFEMRKKNLMELFYDWSEDEAMDGALLNTFKTAKDQLRIWNDTKDQRKEVLDAVKHLESVDKNYYRAVMRNYQALSVQAGARPAINVGYEYSATEARDTVLTKLAFLYRVLLSMGPNRGASIHNYERWMEAYRQTDFSEAAIPKGTDEDVFEQLERTLNESKVLCEAIEQWKQ